jgi:hypothetical protein
VFVQIDVTSPMPRTVRAHTGRDGRFRVAAPPTKPVVLRIVTHTAPAHGFRWPVARVQVPAGGKKDLIVRLETGETIEGRVVDAFGNGIPGLHLRTRVPRAMSAGAYVAAAAVTGLDGSFSLDGLPSGFATVVEVRQSGSVREHVLVDAEDVPTGTTGLRVLRLPVVSVSGRVVDAAGNAVAKRTVVLARKGAALVVESRTDDDGRFVASVAAPGEYVVRLRFATQSGHADRAMGELHTASGYEKTFVAPK